MTSPIRFISHLAPKSYKKWIEENLRYADFSISVWKFVGLIFLYGLAFSTIPVVLLYVYGYTLFWLAAAAGLTFTAVFITFNGILLLIVENRTKFVEEVLPDTLQLMSANLRSGMTPDRALFLSARPEFGFFEKEIKHAAKRLLSGATIDDALREISKRIKSRTLDTTVDLILEGIKKGGELTRLLEETAEDIRNTKLLKKEIKAQVTVYAIFIFFAAAIGAPFMYAISTFLAETMSDIGGAIDFEEMPAQQVGMISIRKMSLDPVFLNNYAVASLVITSIFGGIIIGLIQGGSEKAGLKLVPIMLVLNLSIFFLGKMVISNALGVFVG